jgi:hypothetical protein
MRKIKEILIKRVRDKEEYSRKSESKCVPKNKDLEKKGRLSYQEKHKKRKEREKRQTKRKR